MTSERFPQAVTGSSQPAARDLQGSPLDAPAAPATGSNDSGVGVGQHRTAGTVHVWGIWGPKKAIPPPPKGGGAKKSIPPGKGGKPPKGGGKKSIPLFGVTVVAAGTVLATAGAVSLQRWSELRSTAVLFALGLLWAAGRAGTAMLTRPRPDARRLS